MNPLNHYSYAREGFRGLPWAGWIYVQSQAKDCQLLRSRFETCRVLKISYATFIMAVINSEPYPLESNSIY